jgi:spermidine synthase
MDDLNLRSPPDSAVSPLHVESTPQSPSSSLATIIREYLAIALQEMGLRAAARRLRMPAKCSQRSAPVDVPSPHAAVGVEPDAARRSGSEMTGGVTPIVVDTESERHLQFSSGALQSRMRLDDPYALLAPYTRQMMSFLLFDPDPEDILLIGLGGGSMAKFCYRNLRHTRITVVESDARVIALRDAFCIPADDHRFRIVHDDGARYLARRARPADAILVDAFDEAGVSPSLATQDFFRQASRLLSSTGVLIMNLHGDPERFAEHLQQARTVFGDRALLAHVTANDNDLLYALAPSAPAPSARHLFLRARHLQAKMALNFRHYLRQLRDGRAV